MGQWAGQNRDHVKKIPIEILDFSCGLVGQWAGQNRGHVKKIPIEIIISFVVLWASGPAKTETM